MVSMCFFSLKALPGRECPKRSRISNRGCAAKPERRCVAICAAYVFDRGRAAQTESGWALATGATGRALIARAGENRKGGGDQRSESGPRPTASQTKKCGQRGQRTESGIGRKPAGRDVGQHRLGLGLPVLDLGRRHRRRSRRPRRSDGAPQPNKRCRSARGRRGGRACTPARHIPCRA